MNSENEPDAAFMVECINCGDRTDGEAAAVMAWIERHKCTLCNE
jgi:hypothetical protein